MSETCGEFNTLHHPPLAGNARSIHVRSFFVFVFFFFTLTRRGGTVEVHWFGRPYLARFDTSKNDGPPSLVFED